MPETWGSIEICSSDSVLTEALVRMEERSHADHGWDRPGAMLAVVYSEVFDENEHPEALQRLPAETISKANESAASGVITLNLMSDLPELVVANPYVGLATMVDLITEDVFKDEAEWLRKIVSRPGFIGFTFLLNEMRENETGKQERRQRLLFSSSTHGMFAVHREEDGQIQSGWLATCALRKEDRIMWALVKLNEVSHMLRSLLAYHNVEVNVSS